MRRTRAGRGFARLVGSRPGIGFDPSGLPGPASVPGLLAGRSTGRTVSSPGQLPWAQSMIRFPLSCESTRLVLESGRPVPALLQNFVSGVVTRKSGRPAASEGIRSIR